MAFADTDTSAADDTDVGHMGEEVRSRGDEGDGSPYMLEESARLEE